MSESSFHTVAQSTTRLIPNCTTERKLEVPGDLPGVVIFLHGVNDPGGSYESVETGLCQGVNERLDRPDLRAGRYGAYFNAAKAVPHEQREDALQAKALQAGWQQALETLPEGHKPVRVFYDSTDNINGEIALTNALHGLNIDGTGIELGNVDEGYDIGRRLGNTGVSGALVEINLATIASYQEGGVSAVVYAGKDGSTTVQMVRPPDEARKAKNQQTHGVDPFRFRMPGR